MIRRCAAIFLATAVVAGLAAIGAAPSVGAVTQSTVIIQGGTTPVDSGLYQNVILPLFTKQFPQYKLEYVSVGTAQAITNAQAGQGDVLFTHSPAAESAFVSSGYSYEAGGRLVMASDFVTVGPKTDPASAVALGNHNAVGAFKAIALAGAGGRADFVSRGDGSGTNKNELSIWKLTGIPLTASGEPADPSNPGQDAPWYHKSGVGQAQNLQITNQCPFSSGECYTLSDSGTFNYLAGNGTVPALEIVSRYNDGIGALGGVGLLLNPYHVYAVNPARITNAHINLPGALAFLNFMTSPSTQAAIGKYPNAKTPAFFPDARPDVVITQSVPATVLGNATVTVAGTVKPNYFLDPAITNSPVFLERAGAPGVIIASATVGVGGVFSMSFAPTISDTYSIFVPAFPDGLVLPTNTAYRQSTSVTLRKMTVNGVVTIALSSKKGLDAGFHGTAAPLTNRRSAKVQLQYKSGSTWRNLGNPIAMADGTATYSKFVAFAHAGTWSVRAHFTDANVAAANSATVSVVLH
jgi:tungstate transport system substrate-binding protein